MELCGSPSPDFLFLDAGLSLYLPT